MAINPLSIITGLGGLIGGMFPNTKDTKLTGLQAGAAKESQESKARAKESQKQTSDQRFSENSKQRSRSDSSSTGSSASQSTGVDIGSSRDVTSQVGSTKGDISRLDAETSDMLRGNVQRLLGGAEANNAILSKSLESRAGGADFDEAGFVAGVEGAARSTLNDELNTKLNRITDMTGGGRGNTMAALLAGKEARSTEAQFGGISAEARARAAEIGGGLDASNASEIAALAGAQQQGFGQQLTALLGANEKSSNLSDITGSQSSRTKNTSTLDADEQTSRDDTSKSVIGTSTDSRTKGKTDLNTKSVQTQTNVAKKKEKIASRQTGLTREGGGVRGLFNGLGDVFNANY